MTLCLSGGEPCSIPSIAQACCGSADGLKGNVKSLLGTDRVEQEFRHSAGHRKTIGGQNLMLQHSRMADIYFFKKGVIPVDNRSSTN